MLTYIKAHLGMNDEGATALEYGMLVAFIAIIIAVAVGAFGNELKAFFEGIGDQTGIVAGTAPVGS